MSRIQLKSQHESTADMLDCIMYTNTTVVLMTSWALVWISSYNSQISMKEPIFYVTMTHWKVTIWYLNTLELYDKQNLYYAR